VHILHVVEMSMSTTQWPTCRWRMIHHYCDIYSGQFVMTDGRPAIPSPGQWISYSVYQMFILR